MAAQDGVPDFLKQRWVQVVLVVVLAAWAHKTHRYGQYASKPFPDSWYRDAPQHRSYIAGLKDFADLYTQGVGDGDADQLEGELGVHTRCHTTQVALVSYYCGTAVGREPQNVDQLSLAQLSDLLRALHAVPAAQRARAVRKVLWRQEVLADVVYYLEQGFTLEKAEKAAAAGRRRQREDDDEGVYTGGEEEEEEEEEEEPAAWDGVRLPQLVLRFHVDGDSETGHTFVVAMRPDLSFDLYQSFIGKFTLHDYLAGHPQPLTYEQMQQFVADMKALESAESWTSSVDAQYKKLCGVSLVRTTPGYRGAKLVRSAAASKHNRGQRGAGLRGYDLGEAEALSIRWKLVCSIPPNSTAQAESGAVPFAPYRFS